MTRSPGATEGCLGSDELERLASRGALERPGGTDAAGCARWRSGIEEIRACNAFVSRHADALRAGMATVPLEMPVIPGYRVVARIEAGGQGVVYKAVQTGTHRTVAVKMLRDGAL